MPDARSNAPPGPERRGRRIGLRLRDEPGPPPEAPPRAALGEPGGDPPTGDPGGVPHAPPTPTPRHSAMAASAGSLGTWGMSHPGPIPPGPNGSTPRTAGGPRGEGDQRPNDHSRGTHRGESPLRDVPRGRPLGRGRGCPNPRAPERLPVDGSRTGRGGRILRNSVSAPKILRNGRCQTGRPAAAAEVPWRARPRTPENVCTDACSACKPPWEGGASLSHNGHGCTHVRYRMIRMMRGR